jgi:NDP-sugar pyrophosphorylase family protein
MILAAGYGTRLRPLTDTLPKPLVPILNRPLLEYTIACIRAAGIREIVVNLHYRGEQIRQWLGTGERLGVAVTYSEEQEILGSAGGVRRVRSFFESDPALIIHGDLLFDVDLRALIQYHLSRKAHATLVLHPAHHRYHYGIIKVNPQGEIAQFVDHQAPWIAGPFVDTVFTGVQVLDPVVLDTIWAEPVAILTTDVYPRLLSRAKRFYGYLMRGYWSDIGTPLRYWEANLDMLQGLVDPAGTKRESEAHQVNEQRPRRTTNHQIQPPIALHATVRIGRGATIGPEVAVSEGCEIAAGTYLRRSILWPRVRIGRQATVERTIITNDVTIPPGSHLVGKIASLSGVTDL